MDKQQVLELHDRELRMGPADFGATREDTGVVIRYRNQNNPGAWITYARLTLENIDRVIREQIDDFNRMGRDFEWKVYDHDFPPDLKDRLAAYGFEIEEPEALAVLDLDEAPETLFASPRSDVRQLTRPEQLVDVVQVEQQVWGEPREWLQSELGEQMQRDPQHFQVYVAYVDGTPASAAWVRFHEGTHFASLWGGSTVETYRRRGIYHDLVGVRAREARQRDFRYLTVDASPMSRPILEKLGFEVLTYSHPCVWKVRAA